MPKNFKTERYRFKLCDILFNVDLDSSFFSKTTPVISDVLCKIKQEHYHVTQELFFIGEDPLTVFYDDKSVEYKNCILCIPAKFCHFSSRNNDYRITFSYSYTEKTGKSFEEFFKNICNSPTPIKLETDEKVLTYVSELYDIFISDSYVNEEIATSLLKLIFYKMYTLNTQKQNGSSTLVNESYLLTIDAIINSFQDDINLQTIADALHLSTKQTSRIILKAYNKSLSQLLIEKRLSVACQLLRQTDSSISDIVKHVNFPSESYFYHKFKKEFGCTPYKYKKQI